MKVETSEQDDDDDVDPSCLDIPILGLGDIILTWQFVQQLLSLLLSSKRPLSSVNVSMYVGVCLFVHNFDAKYYISIWIFAPLPFAYMLQVVYLLFHAYCCE